MADTSPLARTDTAPVEAGPARLIYIGPRGHVSPLLGPLVPGASYAVDDSALARYLCAQHPDFWRVPAPPKE